MRILLEVLTNTYVVIPLSTQKYNFASSLGGYEKIKNDCSVGVDEESIKPCNPLILKEGCNDTHFYRNYLIAEKYLTYLKGKEKSLIVENACKYFSYWVYKEMIMEKAYSYSVSELHNIIMQNNNVNICENYVEDITPEISKNIENLNKLYQIFKEIFNGDKEFDCVQAKKCVEFYYGFEDSCYSKSDNPFCKEIENFREEYNKIMKRAMICPKYQTLQPYQKRPERSSNTIPVAAITAITFASIMTYKFTPLGSWVRYRLSGNKNLRNKLEKEFKASQNSSELQDMEYRVPYNSS